MDKHMQRVANVWIALVAVGMGVLAAVVTLIMPSLMGWVPVFLALK